MAGQDQGSGLSSMLLDPLSGRPQWGEEPVSKGSCPGFQTSLQVPRTPPAHVALAARGVRGPLPVMGGRVFRVHIPRGEECCLQEVGPRQDLAVWVPLLSKGRS